MQLHLLHENATMLLAALDKGDQRHARIARQRMRENWDARVTYMSDNDRIDNLPHTRQHSYP